MIALTFIDYMGVRLLGTLSVAFGLLSGVGGAVGVPVAAYLVSLGQFQSFSILGALLIALAVPAAAKAPYPAIKLEEQASQS